MLSQTFSRLKSVLTIISVSMFISMAYIHSHVYNLPPLIIKITSGLIGGIFLGLISNDMREVVISSFITLLMSVITIVLVLSLPVFLGIVNEPGLANIFILSAIRDGVYDTIFLFPSLVISAIMSGLVKEHLSHVQVEGLSDKSLIM